MLLSSFFQKSAQFIYLPESNILVLLPGQQDNVLGISFICRQVLLHEHCVTSFWFATDWTVSYSRSVYFAYVKIIYDKHATPKYIGKFTWVIEKIIFMLCLIHLCEWDEALWLEALTLTVYAYMSYFRKIYIPCAYVL